MNELPDIAPELSKMKKENPFKVPVNYFDELPTRVQDRVSRPEPTSVFQKWYWLLKPQLSLAASMLAFAVVASLLFTGISMLNKTDKTGVVLASNSQAIEYDTYSSFDENIIVDYIVDDSQSSSSEVLKDSEIIDYLEYDGVSYDILLEEL